MNRRALLTLGTGFSVSVLSGFKPLTPTIDKGNDRRPLLLADLEPDGMSKTYRRYRLLIIGQRDDEKAGALAQAAVVVLGQFLPGSRSSLIRAADTRRVGILIGTRLQDIGIMTREGAEALFQATAPFTDVRGVPLRTIVSFGHHLLVVRTDLAPRHAYLLAKALNEHNDLLPEPAGAPDGIIPGHEGAQAFFDGKAMPAE
ncbi:TAXI family TRAP transporter solute-binding subunit [Mesorhizobium sp. B2-4-9]|uniref:TAXI family TRAP transporter solute-binding subunit n=1 Tax=Mesorhizobium sp. B2-4-9 TaxID=2589940 RepID=UPI001FEDBDE0|nr:TAXI family TRAP transporter solute-binding subunit [Mesorhizobium sp. B2-4-9]